MNEVKERVFEIIEDVSAVRACDTSASLVEDLALDSLCMVMLLVMIEDVFSIELDESDMDPYALITVQDVIDLVTKYRVMGEEAKNEQSSKSSI